MGQCLPGWVTLTYTRTDITGETIQTTVCNKGLEQRNTTDASGHFLPVTTSYVFTTCWSYECLGQEFVRDQPPMTMNVSLVSWGTDENPLYGNQVKFTIMQPKCAQVEVYLMNDKDEEEGEEDEEEEVEIVAIRGGQDSTITVPGSAISDLHVAAIIQPQCDNKYMAVIMTPVYNTAALPPAPRHVCPCWVTPTYNATSKELVCPGIQLPIILHTVSPDHNLTTARRVLCEGCPIDNDATSYAQCIDPANWDYWTGILGTGRMAMSYCWRYGCLPPAFSRNKFKAEITLERWNLARMPGGATYLSEIRSTNGVQVAVKCKPKNSTYPHVAFSGTGSRMDDSVKYNITLPEEGISECTFKWLVPVGFDDLSASVTMDAWPGPPPPSPPPGALPRCPTDPRTDGTCDEGRTLAIFTRTYPVDGTPDVVRKCIPNPYYDRNKDKWAFSMCFTYACVWPWDMTSATNQYERYWQSQGAARIYHPYNITIPDIREWGLEQIAQNNQWYNDTTSITYDIYMTALKPRRVNVTVALTPANASFPVMGPFDRDQPLVIPRSCSDCTNPLAGPISSIAITLSIPAQPWLDGNCAAVELRARNRMPRPPAPPPRPPLPPQRTIAPNTTVVKADFECLAEISSQAELDALVAFQVAEERAKLDSYILTFPVAFSEYNHLDDCSSDIVYNFTCDLAYQFNLSIHDVSATCSYASSNTQRRRHTRALNQYGGISACAEGQANIYLDIAVRINPNTGNLDNTISRFQGIMFSKFSFFDVCAPAYKSTLISVYKVVETPVASSMRRVMQSVTSTCSSMTNMLSGLPADVLLRECGLTTWAVATGMTPPPPEEESGPNTAAIIGATVGTVGGLALVAAVVAMYVMRRNRDDRKAIGTAMQRQMAANIEVHSDPDQEARAAVATMKAAGNPAYSRPAGGAMLVPAGTMGRRAAVETVAAADAPRVGVAVPRLAATAGSASSPRRGSATSAHNTPTTTAAPSPFEVPRSAESFAAPAPIPSDEPEITPEGRELPMRDAPVSEVRRSRPGSASVESLAAVPPRPSSGGPVASPRMSAAGVVDRPGSAGRVSDSGAPRLAFPPASAVPAAAEMESVAEQEQEQEDDESMGQMVARMLQESGSKQQ